MSTVLWIITSCLLLGGFFNLADVSKGNYTKEIKASTHAIASVAQLLFAISILIDQGVL